MNFYIGGSGSGQPFTSNVLSQIVLTRDGASDEVAGYVNGVQMFTFIDGGNAAVFDGPNNIIQFFKDDNVTGGGEASAGSVDRILIYDAPLSASEVANINAIPEPSPAVLGLWATALGLGLRRRAQHDPSARIWALLSTAVPCPLTYQFSR